ncbi:MAG: S8 family peptidase [Bacteroidales bacterium]|nr:S8 family peptidase [Bacteroidales bacterium]
MFWSGTSGSCYGSHISVIAPGNYIYGLSYNSNTSYNSYWGGTSQAAPHVAGLSSLLLSQDPDRTPADIKAIIQNTSEDQVGDQAEDTPGWDPYYGYGRINAYAALIYDLAGISKTDYNTMRISPNPTNGEVKIQWDTFAFIPETLTIQSLLGNEVMKIKLNLVPEKYIYLNLSALVGGVYIISLEKPGKRGIQKLVVYE